MKRSILSGRPAPTRPFVRSEFREEVEYRLYFDRAAGLGGGGLPHFMNSPG